MSSPTTATNLSGKVALITGSSRGMGKENALELARRGADIVINYVSSASAADEVVSAIKGLGRKAIAIKADVSKPAETAAMFETAKKEFGYIDIVVSNSGLEHFGNVLDVTPEEFDRIFHVNTRGQFFVAQQGYKHLEHGGKIILLSSVSAQAKGVLKHAVYSGSKAAVEAFARCFAKDFGDKQITVNAIAPGGVKTDMYADAARKYIPNSEHMSDDKIEELVSNMSPLGRLGFPHDVATVVAFLASDDASWINGQVVEISGGAVL